MPWKVASVLEQRLAVILQIVRDKRSVRAVARESGVSRKTLHKWLARYRKAGNTPDTWRSLVDRSHRPVHSLVRCPPGAPADPAGSWQAVSSADAGKG